MTFLNPERILKIIIALLLPKKAKMNSEIAVGTHTAVIISSIVPYCLNN